jgi:hypothetical protein
MAAAGATGITYTFSVYSGALKHAFALQQSELDTIGTVGSYIGTLTWATGMVADRLGPAAAVALGGTMQTLSYVLQWGVMSGRIPFAGDSPLPTLCALTTLATLATSFVSAAVFSTCVRNFPVASRGAAVGLAKTWVALAGGATTQVYGALRRARRRASDI